MFHRILVFATALLSALLFSGCFDIEEVIHFKTAESGTVTYTVDVTKMAGAVKMLEDMLGGKKEESSGNTELKSSFEEAKLVLESIKGVSNVTAIDDETNYRFGIRADFDNIRSLNRVLAEIYRVSSAKGYPDFVRRKKKTYEYLEPVDLKESFSESFQFGKGEQEAMDPAMFLDDMTFTSKIIFRDKKIKKATNVASLVSGDKHTIVLTTYPFNPAKSVPLKNKVTVQ